MQNRIVFLKTVNEAERLSVLDFINSWQDKSATIRLQTSGSTGKPKLIEVSKKAMLASAMATGTYFEFNRRQTNLLALSANYIAGKMQIVRSLVHHMTLVVVPTSSNPLLELIDEKIDFAAFVPMQAQAILADTSTRAKFEAIPHVIIGGAPVNQQLFTELASLKNKSFATFGMTETVSHVALRRIAEGNATYEAMPNVRFEINENDCLIIEATRLTDEKIVTNDRVELINSKTFKWIGRADYTINSGGVKIQPELVEGKIASLIDRPFYIHGVDDDLLGQKVVLCIEGEPLSEKEEHHLIEAIQTRVSKFELPKNIIYITKFKRTATGKIMRSAIQ